MCTLTRAGFFFLEMTRFKRMSFDRTWTSGNESRIDLARSRCLLAPRALPSPVYFSVQAAPRIPLTRAALNKTPRLGNYVPLHAVLASRTLEHPLAMRDRSVLWAHLLSGSHPEQTRSLFIQWTLGVRSVPSCSYNTNRL